MRRLYIELAFFCIALAGCGGDSGVPMISAVAIGTVDAMGNGFYPFTGEQTLDRKTEAFFGVPIKIRVSGYSGAGDVKLKWTVLRLSDTKVIGSREGTQTLPAPNVNDPFETEAFDWTFDCAPQWMLGPLDGEPLRFTLQLMNPHDDTLLAETSSEVTPVCRSNDYVCLEEC
jgi:hypothetical protein